MLKFNGLQYYFLALLMISSTFSQAEQITSDNNVRFIDGSNLIIKDKRISLYAITVPELGSFCDERKQKFDCGLIARSSLMDMSAGAKIICQKASAPHNEKKYKCLSNGYDLSEGMVYTGWAKPLDTAPQHFQKLAREAKIKKHGIWRILNK